MRTREVQLIPRAGSAGLARWNERKPVGEVKKRRVLSVRKVLTGSGIVRGKVIRVKEAPVKAVEAKKEEPPKEEVKEVVKAVEDIKPKMTEVECRMAEYLEVAEKVVNHPEEIKSGEAEATKTEEPVTGEVSELGLSFVEKVGSATEAKEPEERMSRRKRRRMKREAMLKARETESEVAEKCS